MSGVPAGRLEIEIMASVARLQDDMRKIERAVGQAGTSIARDARAANDNLRNVGKGGGEGIQQYSREVAQLKAKLEPAWAAAQRFRREQELVNRAAREGAITAAQQVQLLRANAAAYASAGKAVSAQTGAQRAGFQQLSYQLGDVATQFSMGARPMQIFAAQASQVVGAVGLMSSSSKGLIGFLGGPWGQVFIGAITILGTFASASYGAADASNAQKDAAEDLTDATNALHDATVRESQSTWASIQTDINKAIALRQRADEARKAALAELDLARSKAIGARASISPGAPSYSNTFNLGEQAKQEATIRDLDKRIAEQQRLIDKNQATIRLKIGEQTRMKNEAKIDASTAATLKYERAEDALNRRLHANTITAADYDLQHQKLLATRERELEAANKSERTSRTRKERLSDEERAVIQQNKATERYIENLSDEIAKIGLDEKALRALEVAKEIEAAQTEKQKTKIAELSAKREEALALYQREMKAKEAAKENAGIERDLKALEREVSVRHLLGNERERALLLLEQQAEIGDLLEKIAAAELAGEVELVAELKKRLELIQKIHGIQIDNIDFQDGQRKAREEAELLNNELREMIGLLEGIGGFGSVLGALIGLSSGNIDAIGGPFGEILNMATGTKTDSEGRVVARTLGDELREIFKLNGEFGKTMTSILQGAGTGVVAARAFGMNSTAEQIGGAIGGALGQIAGQALGSALGPLGSVIGGVLGSLVGGLFNSPKTGGARITGVDSVSTFGNSASRRSAAGTLAGQVIAGLEQVADLLGADIGGFNTSIGIYNDNYRVSTSGSTRLGGYRGSESENEARYGLYNFGDDAASAVKFAIADAIRDGALLGLRESTQRLVQGGDDIEAQIQKALDFEGVFSDLRQATDPLGYNLDMLAKEFDRLSEIFEEAGANAEEYAQLEQLLQIKRDDIIEKARLQAIDDLRDKRELEIRILELLGRKEDALFASRELELASLEESLRPLQSMIYTLEDARSVIEQFGPLAAELREFKQELLGSATRDTFGLVAARFQQTADLARNGDADALGRLRDSASEFLDAARDNAASALDYRRAVGQVLVAVDDGIFAADSQIEYAQLQIDAIAESNGILTSIRDLLDSQQATITANSNRIVTLLQRFEGEGLTVVTDSDTPIQVEVVGP